MEMKTTALFGAGLVWACRKAGEWIFFVWLSFFRVIALVFPEKGEEPIDGEEDLL